MLHAWVWHMIVCVVWFIESGLLFFFFPMRSEVKDVGNKLGAELRKLGEIVADNEWGMISFFGAVLILHDL